MAYGQHPSSSAPVKQIVRILLIMLLVVAMVACDSDDEPSPP